MTAEQQLDWSAIKRIVQQGALIDVQFTEIDMPLPYTVLMVLDEPVIVCRASQSIELRQVGEGVGALVFIPTARDLCLFKATVLSIAERGAYLALRPVSNPEFLRHRRSIRVKGKDDISYRVQFAGKSNIYKGLAIQDVGRGGIGLVVYAAGPIPEKSDAEIKVKFPGIHELVQAHGVVSHCIPHGTMPRTYRIGLQFTKISPRDQQIIALYVDKGLSSVRPAPPKS